jgi:uncharacterized repeat protein (TIGR01451 family)
MKNIIQLSNLILGAAAFCSAQTSALFANDVLSPSILVSKAVQLEDDPMSTGSQVRPAIYVITITNTGEVPLLENSIEIIDYLPESLTFNNVDFDGDGPRTSFFAYNPNNSGLALDSADLIPISAASTENEGKIREGADENVRGLRIRPRGAMNPKSSFTVKLRVFDVDRQKALFEVVDDQDAVSVPQSSRSVTGHTAS